MDATIHARISVKHWGGVEEDYYPLHDFIDGTKEFCSDNRHRIFHTLWAVKRIIIPIFGHTITNSEGKAVSVKEICEKDHILPDYHYRFIPTLNDFLEAVEFIDHPNWQQEINTIHTLFKDYPEVSQLLLSPLAHTGQLQSLLLTHNSWFIHEIIPKIFPIPLPLINYTLTPKIIFENMRFELWMDNAAAFPPSAKMVQKILLHKLETEIIQ